MSLAAQGTFHFTMALVGQAPPLSAPSRYREASEDEGAWRRAVRQGFTSRSMTPPFPSRRAAPTRHVARSR